MDNRLTFSAPVELRAAGGKGKRPTFSISAYGGGPMTPGGFYYPVAVDLAGLKARGQSIPILLDHDPTRIIGQSTSIRIDGQGVAIEGTITGDDADSQKVVSHARNGFRWQASIGASIARREFVEAGKSAVVNGRTVSGPIIVAREATLYETSFVAIGADASSSATVAASQRACMDFEVWLSAQGFDPSTLNDKQRTSLKAAYDREQGGEAVVAAGNPAERERERIAGIRAACGSDGVLAGQAIQENWTIDQCREVKLERLQGALPVAPSPYTFSASASRATPSYNIAAIEASVLRRSGHGEFVEKTFDARTLEAADKLGAMSLVDVAAACVRIDGRDVPSSRSDMLKAAFSGASLPVALSNIANKSVLSAFKFRPQTWRMFAAIKSAKDFKKNTSIRPTWAVDLEQVGPDGQLKHGRPSEDNVEWKVDTYGRMFSVNRTDIVNDDLGLFQETGPQMGRSALKSLNDHVWRTILEGDGTFFSTANGNHASGSGTALSVDSLSAGLLAIRQQRDANGGSIDITPRVLAVPPALEGKARQVLESLELNQTGDGSPIANPVHGAVQLIVEDRLGNTDAFGALASSTAWYLFAGPEDGPVFAGFLDGRQEPIVEVQEAPFNTLGVEYRCYFDFGAKCAEPRAAYKSEGAA